MPDLRMSELTTALERACRDAGFDNFMPGAMIGHFVRQVIPTSVEGDRFLLNQFYQWVRQEYPIPDSAFGRAFNLFGPEAARLGLTAVEPPGFDPGFGETIRNWLLGAIDGNQQHATDAAAAPLIPIADAPDLEPLPPVDYSFFAEPAPEAEPAETVVYGTPVDDPEVTYGEPVVDETAAWAVPLDDEAVVYGTPVDGLEAAEAVLADEAGPAPGWPGEDLPGQRSRTAEELRRELWPMVYEEVRSLAEGEVRPVVEAEVRRRLEDEMRPELTRTLAAVIRKELYAELHEGVSAEIRAAEHAPIASEVRLRMEDSVREELRRELWSEVREEVKQDLRATMLPELEGEVRLESDGAFAAPGTAGAEGRPADQTPEQAAADEAGQRGLGLGADDHLLIIRRLRERLAPALREQFARELADLAASLLEKKSAEENERQMSDPDYCLEQIRNYFFPDQPGLWERVKPLVDPGRWTLLVRGLARGDFDRERLARSRPVVREALILKAEIESEMGSAPPRGVSRPRALAEALAGADRALDFALESISATINGI